MNSLLLFLSLLFSALFPSSVALALFDEPVITASIQKILTPDEVLRRLVLGNQRFLDDQRLRIDYVKKARLTAQGQYPSAIILSCIDSRVPPEIVFDQNIGNIFVTRVAANVINDDVLGGLEFATHVAGAKLIVVMGHDSCGAIKGACENVKLGHLTQLLSKIEPAIQQAKETFGKKDCDSQQFINAAAADNVRHVVKMIPKESPIIRQLIKEGKLKIVGAMYHLNTGRVTFFAFPPFGKQPDRGADE